MGDPPHRGTVTQLAHLDEKDDDDQGDNPGELVLLLDGAPHPPLPWDTLRGRLQTLVNRGLRKVVLQGDGGTIPLHPTVWTGLWQSLAGIHPCINTLQLRGITLPPPVLPPSRRRCATWLSRGCVMMMIVGEGCCRTSCHPRTWRPSTWEGSP